jgi:serine protease Do
MNRSIAFLLASLLAGAAFAAPASVQLPEFTELVDANGGAVVNISTTQSVKRPALPPGMDIPNLPEDSPFHDFFRHFFKDLPEQYDVQSLGSGFIISEDGYVMTAAHVVENATEIIVRLTSRKEFSAEIIGLDRRSDVALLKIDGKGLPTVKLGDPSKLKVGEWVLAIGSPFGFENSATAGIVSAKGRSLPNETYVPFIQTDVAINPGNSGGPLFNLDGEVVGINAQIYSRTGGFMGLSFAVPIDIAMNVADQIRESGHVQRGWLGVTIQNVTRDLAESFGMPKPAGALVSDIMADSPAAKSELKVGDVIVEFNGRPINESADLPPLVGQTKIGVAAKLKVVREGEIRDMSVVIGELPEERLAASGTAPPAATPGLLGMQLRDLTPEERTEQGIEYGALVEKVEPGDASRADIRAGDVILQIDRKAVKSADDAREILRGLEKGSSVPVLVRRGGGSIFLVLKATEG